MSEEKTTNQEKSTKEELKREPIPESKPMNREQLESLRNKLQKKYH